MKNRRFAASVLLAISLGGCHQKRADSPTALAVPQRPTPSPARSLGGIWVGEYTADDLDCESSQGPAHANFEQDGAHFSSLLTAQSPLCGFAYLRYEGT